MDMASVLIVSHNCLTREFLIAHTPVRLPSFLIVHNYNYMSVTLHLGGTIDIY